MKRRLNLIMCLSAAVFVFAACDPNPAATAPGTEKPVPEIVPAGPELYDFSMEGITAKAVIQKEDKAVVLTVPPMDISNLKPEVKVPEGVTYTGLPETLADGQRFDLTLTGNNGASSKWTVTINVEPGLAFTLDGQHHILGCGIVHSENTEENAAAGAGVPVCKYDSKRDILFCAAFTENADLAEGYTGLANFTVQNPNKDSQTVISFEHVENYFDLNMALDENDYYKLLSNGSEGELLSGVFSGDAVDGDNETHTIENGFFKYLRLADETTYPKQIQAPN